MFLWMHGVACVPFADHGGRAGPAYVAQGVRLAELPHKLPASAVMVHRVREVGDEAQALSLR